MAGWLFWDVDTQHDFMRADGKLYVPDAEDVIPNLARLTQYARDHGIRVIASADDHVPEHREISSQPDYQNTFPPHCMRGTAGQRKIPETTLPRTMVLGPELQDAATVRARVRRHPGSVLFHKHTFDVFSNPNVEPAVEALDPAAILVYGVALDICDRFTIEGLLARRPQSKLYVVTDATKPINAEKAQALLDSWKSRGVEQLSTDMALEVVTAGATRVHNQ